MVELKKTSAKPKGIAEVFFCGFACEGRGDGGGGRGEEEKIYMLSRRASSTAAFRPSTSFPPAWA